MKLDIRRGQVYWWECPAHNRLHIQSGTRPVVVVSNDVNNAHSGVITIIPFTTQVRRPYPQQVPIVFDGGVSIAIADQITSIPVDELGNYICDLFDFQMDMIDKAIAIQTGLVSPASRIYAE